jgi:hypothetical protein
MSIALILVAERLFITFTHALQVNAGDAPRTPAQAARIALVNHGSLVIAMLLGGILGMISILAVNDRTVRGQLVTMSLLPVPMLVGLTLGITLGGHRTTSLVCLGAVMPIGAYCRRFGSRGVAAGQILFMGDFIGFLLHATLIPHDLGWLISELAVAQAVAIAVRFVVFDPGQAKALARTRRSYAAQARTVAATALELFDDPAHDERAATRLHRRLLRLNETALMIDAQLGDAGAVPQGSSAALLHQRLFDIELSLTNIARFAQALARLKLPVERRSLVRLALLDITHRDAEGARTHARALLKDLRAHPSPPGGEEHASILLHRLAGSVIALADATAQWMTIGSHEGDQATFEPSVILAGGGWLPGANEVSATASREAGRLPGEGIGLAAHNRAAIQMGVAAAGAIALGDVLSPTRFYWAVIAAYLTFLGTNNSGEQVRKALFRVAGTVVGIATGSLCVKAVGHDTYSSIALVLFALFIGFYLMRINYVFLVIAITVMVSMLYVQLDEFSDSLLLLRLEETALGAAVAVAVSLRVLPLRTRRVLRIALRVHVQEIRRLVAHVTGHIDQADTHINTVLRADARRIDASYQTIVATAQPLRRNLFGGVDAPTAGMIRLASASRHYGRNLVLDIATLPALDAQIRADLAVAGAALLNSLDAISDALTGPTHGTYTAAASWYDRAESRLEAQPGTARFWLRDLKLIDEAMARIAQTLGMTLEEPFPGVSSGGPPDR